MAEEPAIVAKAPNAKDQQKIKEIAADIEKSKQRVEQEEVKRRDVLSALYTINQKIRQIVWDKSKMQGEQGGLIENIQKLNVKLTELEETSADLKKRLAMRLKTLYHLGGGPSTARMLSSATSSAQLDRQMKIMGMIAERDRDLLKEFQTVHQEIEQKKEHLAQRSQRLTEVAAQLKSREQQLLAEQNLKNRLLDGIRKKHVFALQNLQQLKEQTKQLKIEDDTLLDFLTRPSFADEKGRLAPPLAGAAVVQRPYGIEKSGGQHGWSLSHKGVRLNASAGQPVKAIFEGKVAWVGEIAGLGQALILDHGDHYYSVYAETQNPQVQAGDEVHRNQTIASVGQSAWEKTPGLHFEIRHFSEPDDPLQWMKGTSL